MQNPNRRSRQLQRLHCVNCNICVNTLRRFVVVELDIRVISLLSNWIHPEIVTEDDVICEACWEILLQAVNEQLADDNSDQQASSSHQECSLNTSDQQADRSRLGHSQVCFLCGISLLRRRSELIIKRNASVLDRAIVTIIESRMAPRQVSSSDCICRPCWLRCKRSAQQIVAAQSTHSGEEAPEPPQLPEQENQRARSRSPVRAIDPEIETGRSTTLLNYKRAANTASHCLFIGCTNEHCRIISDNLRATILSNYHFYIPILARVCVEHLHSNNWNELYNSPNSISSFTVEQIEHVFSFVNPFKCYLNFNSMESIQEIDENLFFYWIGRTKDQFTALLHEVPRIQEANRGVLGLAAFLMKMRTGESDDRISKLLEVPRRTLERLMDSVRELLLQDFVPRNLGIEHVTRENLLLHNLILPNGLYNNENNEKLILICDGTYIFINKSSNYMFQKETYSLHKYRNLLKPFLLVACDGFIIDCFGPYKATTSDAEIMISLFENENAPLRSYLQENDIFILDRGFRDSISLLEACNYRPYMPDSLLPGEHQLTTEQANRSRCITICRWVVELVNGYFKRDFKLLRQDYFNKTVPHMMQNFQIAASLINRFGVRLKNRADATEMLRIIRERRHLPNNLGILVESYNLNRQSSNFVRITADRDNLLNFPRMDMNELILFALGTYQIRQAHSYYGEHIRFHGMYRIEVSREIINSAEYNLRGSGNNTLIRGKIQSRHIRRKQYFVYILIENNVPGRDGIPEYYCNCLVGRRTVGCCAHVMTIVWYLGWARYEPNISPPAPFLDDVVIRDDIE